MIESDPDDDVVLAPIGDLMRLMRRLRDPETGCPWDIKQTFASISAYTIEEAYEVADAIARESWDDLEDELGDLLLQVVFHARIGEEQGLFDLGTVARAIHRKLVRRHPHIFAVGTSTDETAQRAIWETIKAEERRRKAERTDTAFSALSGVARTIPPLQRAHKLQERAARVGFDWPDTAQVWDKLLEEIREVEEVIDRPDARLAQEEEIGDLLFTIVNLSRHLKIDPDQALRRANEKFERRFGEVERQATERGKDVEALPLAALETFWAAAKVLEKSTGPDANDVTKRQDPGAERNE
ncbi:ATP diphosphatase [Arboricoccus pini]|uniref:Nucleoside triphosphate pyrophosphohydrolase n=1 Tax=Arboricoccus pini TaxID=1963835 RepID=A0A212QP42_9PROT|nr:nucleoside triphosphate pyrophosphohydrolase [Arboricoccus pini]SNB61033.1 ATP diphosphatase [Arboricoccus pini]